MTHLTSNTSLHTETTAASIAPEAVATLAQPVHELSDAVAQVTSQHKETQTSEAAEKFLTEFVPMSDVRIDGGTQARVEINDATVKEYGEALCEGVKLPAIVLYYEKSSDSYWLADGFHRFHAHRLIGRVAIPAFVKEGTRRDAVLHAIGANTTHGLRRSNEDKRRAVDMLLQDEEWVQWPDTAIAKACGVSAALVADRRRPIIKTLDDSHVPESRTVTRNGTTYQQKVRGSAAPKPATPAALTPAISHEGNPELESFRPSEEEVAAAIEAEQADQARQLAILDAEHPLGRAMRRILQLEKEVRGARDIIASLQEDKNALIRQVKGLLAHRKAKEAHA